MQIPTPKNMSCTQYTYTYAHMHIHTHTYAHVSFRVQRPYICFPNGLPLHYSTGRTVCNFVLYNM